MLNRISVALITSLCLSAAMTAAWSMEIENHGLVEVKKEHLEGVNSTTAAAKSIIPIEEIRAVFADKERKINPTNNKKNCVPCALSFHNWINQKLDKPHQVAGITNPGINMHCEDKFAMLLKESDINQLQSKTLIIDLEDGNHERYVAFDAVTLKPEDNYLTLTNYLNTVGVRDAAHPNLNFRSGLIYLINQKDTATGHLINFYKLPENGALTTYIVDPQLNTIQTVEQFLTTSFNMFLNYLYVWFDKSDSALPRDWRVIKIEEDKNNKRPHEEDAEGENKKSRLTSNAMEVQVNNTKPEITDAEWTEIRELAQSSDINDRNHAVNKICSAYNHTNENDRRILHELINSESPQSRDTAARVLNHEFSNASAWVTDFMKSHLTDGKGNARERDTTARVINYILESKAPCPWVEQLRDRFLNATLPQNHVNTLTKVFEYGLENKAPWVEILLTKYLKGAKSPERNKAVAIINRGIDKIIPGAKKLLKDLAESPDLNDQNAVGLLFKSDFNGYANTWAGKLLNDLVNFKDPSTQGPVAMVVAQGFANYSSWAQEMLRSVSFYHIDRLAPILAKGISIEAHWMQELFTKLVNSTVEADRTIAANIIVSGFTQKDAWAEELLNKLWKSSNSNQQETAAKAISESSDGLEMINDLVKDEHPNAQNMIQKIFTTAAATPYSHLKDSWFIKLATEFFIDKNTNDQGPIKHLFAQGFQNNNAWVPVLVKTLLQSHHRELISMAQTQIYNGLNNNSPWAQPFMEQLSNSTDQNHRKIAATVEALKSNDNRPVLARNTAIPMSIGNPLMSQTTPPQPNPLHPQFGAPKQLPQLSKLSQQQQYLQQQQQQQIQAQLGTNSKPLSPNSTSTASSNGNSGAQQMGLASITPRTSQGNQTSPSSQQQHFPPQQSESQLFLQHVLPQLQQTQLGINSNPFSQNGGNNVSSNGHSSAPQKGFVPINNQTPQRNGQGNPLSVQNTINYPQLQQQQQKQHQQQHQQHWQEVEQQYQQKLQQQYQLWQEVGQQYQQKREQEQLQKLQQQYQLQQEYNKAKADADSGDATACINVGQMLMKGKGCQKDLVQANLYFEKAAIQSAALQSHLTSASQEIERLKLELAAIKK